MNNNEENVEQFLVSKNWLTVSESAIVLSVSRVAVYKMIDAGHLGVKKFRGLLLVSRKSLEEYAIKRAN